MMNTDSQNEFASEPKRPARNRRLAPAIVAVMLTCSAAAMLVVRAHNLPATPGYNPPLPMAVRAVADPQTTEPDKIKAEVITLRPHGFVPARITRPAGRFILAFNNRSGLDDIQLQLDGDTGVTVQTARASLQRLNWRAIINLNPGDYSLKVAGHPEWTCIIAITN